MDQLPPFGRIVGQIIGPTYGVYKPLVQLHAEEIEATKKETYAYASDARQQLDIYTPSPSAPTPESKKGPILLFMYGGAFANGDKVLADAPLIYTNFGYFFAEKLGFETIIMDYRLIKHGAKFPSGAEDLDMALKWIDRRYTGQKRDVYLLGNSAGGMNVANWMFEPAFQQSRRHLISGSDGIRLSGVVLLGSLYHFQYSSPILRQNIAGYLGENLDDNSPTASLKRCEEVGELKSAAWPRILIAESELEPEDILKACQDFLELLKESASLDVTYKSFKGHNHISPPLALGTAIPEEEDWGYTVGLWLQN
jgi:acetyl esterase/lipase